MVDVQLTTVPSETVAVVHRRVAVDRLPTFFAEAFTKVAEALVDAGGTISGPPFWWYHGMPGAEVEVSAGFPVAGDVHTPDGGVVVTERPGGRAFVAVHTGPYDGLATTYAEVEGYVDEYGLGQREDCWEEYLTEPTGDPSTWRTRVVVPLR